MKKDLAYLSALLKGSCKWLLLGIFVLVPLSVGARSSRTSPSDVYVKGYTRSDGTYVSPHYRSAPDGVISNNYSCIDDGKCGASSYSGSYSTPLPSSVTTAPSPSCLGNTRWDGSACVCLSGFTKSSTTDLCITLSTWCAEKYGPRSYFSNSTCYCGSGDSYDQASDSCRPQAVAQVIENPLDTANRLMPRSCDIGYGWSDYFQKCIALAKEMPAEKSITTVRRINVRLSPSPAASILGTTIEKKQYTLLEEKPEWVKVQFGKKTGWVMKKLVTIK